MKFVSGFGGSQVFLVELYLNGNQNPTGRGLYTKEVLRLYEIPVKVWLVRVDETRQCPSPDPDRWAAVAKALEAKTW